MNFQLKFDVNYAIKRRTMNSKIFLKNLWECNINFIVFKKKVPSDKLHGQ
jgi:hypothetical protein